MYIYSRKNRFNLGLLINKKFNFTVRMRFHTYGNDI